MSYRWGSVQNGDIVNDFEGDYTSDPNGYYIYVQSSTLEVDGVEYQIGSMFFASDGKLYEVEMTDGMEASNYIEYELYQP